MTSENLILKTLEYGPQPTLNLLHATSEKLGITKQAFYKALRNLKKEEKITIHGKRVSISSEWISLEIDRLERIAALYGSPQQNSLLSGASKAKYTFRNLNELDVFLSHAFLSLSTETKTPVYFYNQHEWYSYGRSGTNSTLAQHLSKKNIPTYITVTGKTFLDKSLASTYNKTPFQYYMSDKKLLGDKAYAIFGDYVLTTNMNSELAQKIDQWFHSNKELTEESGRVIQELMNLKEKSTVVVERNPMLANKLSGVLKKYFVTK